MNNKFHLVLYILVVSLLVFACSPSTENAPQDNPTVPVEIEDAADTEPGSPDIDPAEVYKSNCARCHGEDRSGGRAPALTPDNLSGDAEIYAKIISDGQGGMPSWSGKLSAEEIDALAEWILTTP